MRYDIAIFHQTTQLMLCMCMVRSPNAKCVNEQIDVHLKNSHKNVSRMITARKTAEISSNKLLNRCVAYDTA